MISFEQQVNLKRGRRIGGRGGGFLPKCRINTLKHVKVLFYKVSLFHNKEGITGGYSPSPYLIRNALTWVDDCHLVCKVETGWLSAYFNISRMCSNLAQNFWRLDDICARYANSALTLFWFVNKSTQDVNTVEI